MWMDVVLNTTHWKNSTSGLFEHMLLLLIWVNHLTHLHLKCYYTRLISFHVALLIALSTAWTYVQCGRFRSAFEQLGIGEEISVLGVSFPPSVATISQLQTAPTGNAPKSPEEGTLWPFAWRGKIDSASEICMNQRFKISTVSSLSASLVFQGKNKVPQFPSTPVHLHIALHARLDKLPPEWAGI